MDTTPKPDTVGVDSNTAPTPEAVQGASETPADPPTSRAPHSTPEAVTRPHSTRDGAATAEPNPADRKTARQKIATILWWSVPASTNEEAKARTEQLLDEHHAEVLAGNYDAAAERDCLAMAVQFALQWTPDAPMSLREGIEEILATMPAAEATPDFFRPGHTYADAEYGWKFRVDTITTHPENGERTALGWRFWRDVWEPYACGEDDWDIHLAAGLTDITDTEVSA